MPMKIRVFSSVLLEGVGWIEPGIGDFDPVIGKHLIDIGSAEPYETKIQAVEIKKNEEAKQSSVSQPAQASTRKTLKLSKAKRKS